MLRAVFSLSSRHFPRHVAVSPGGSMEKLLYSSSGMTTQKRSCRSAPLSTTVCALMQLRFLTGASLRFVTDMVVMPRVSAPVVVAVRRPASRRASRSASHLRSAASSAASSARCWAAATACPCRRRSSRAFPRCAIHSAIPAAASGRCADPLADRPHGECPASNACGHDRSYRASAKERNRGQRDGTLRRQALPLGHGGTPACQSLSNPTPPGHTGAPFAGRDRSGRCSG